MLLLFFNVVLLASSVRLLTLDLLSEEAFLGSEGLVSVVGLLEAELLGPGGGLDDGAALADVVLTGGLAGAGLLDTGGLAVEELKIYHLL